MPDNDLSDAHAEILMLRARIMALETAVKALLAAPMSKKIDASITETFEYSIVNLYSDYADENNDVVPLKKTERAHLTAKIVDATWKLDRARASGPAAGWRRFMPQQDEGS